MAIETLEDWNQVLACCCEMPGCPVPTKECESITNDLCGHSLPTHPSGTADEDCLVFATKTSVESYSQIDSYPGEDTDGPDYSINHVETKTYVVNYSFVAGTCASAWNVVEVSDYLELSPNATFGTYVYTTRIAWDYTTTQSEGGSPVIVGTWTEQDVNFANDDPDGEITTLNNGDISGVRDTPTVTNFTVDSSWSKSGFVYSKTISTESTATVTYSNPVNGESALEGLEFPADATGVLCAAALGCSTATKTRFRWIVPDTFPGSYFKITWDILTEPDGWDAETPTVFRSLAAGGTWEWTGPGDPEDADSWKSGWYEIAPPTTPGTRRIVNIRFECYRSTKFGTRPQVTGEGVELPDP